MGDIKDSLLPPLVWTPKSKDTQIDKFRLFVNSKYKTSFENYWQLHKWSTTCYPEYWASVWEFVDVIHSQPYVQVVDTETKLEDIPEWFKGARLNFAENFLRYRDERIAFHIGEETTNEIRQVSYREIYEGTALYAAAMKKAGVKEGDVVACYIPNIVEAVYIMLATTSIGAVWSSASVEFGIMGVQQRLEKISPKLLFITDSHVLQGKKHNILERSKEITKNLHCLKKVIVIPESKDSLSKDISNIPKSCFLPKFLESGRNIDGTVPHLQFNQLPFNHPSFIFFTSGTTGHPKAVVHSAGGMLLMLYKDRILHMNGSPASTVIIYTTVGWISWFLQAGSMLTGGSCLIYNGYIFCPSYSRMFDTIDEIGGTHLLLFPWYLDVLENEGISPVKTHKLKTLHTLCAGASVVRPKNWTYVQKHIKPDIYLACIMGCTDIAGFLFYTNYTIPQYFGEIQSPDLGVSIECWDESGKSVLDQKGELVLTVPLPGLPLGFWGDSNQKFQKAYFSKFPGKGVWTNGDYILINSKTGGYIFYGRSDCVLNPGGERFSSVEIYDVVAKFKEIEDSVCVSQYSSDYDERAVLFLKMKPGYTFSQNLVNRLKAAIESELTVNHSPAVVLETKAIPYTVTGKKVEVAVKKAIAGEDGINRASIINPESIDIFYKIPELQNY